MKKMRGVPYAHAENAGRMRSALGLLTLVLLVAGCAAPVEPMATPTLEAREPFSARRESEDGTTVAWSGYTRGYDPGAEEAFELSIRNETDEAWPGRYCLHLMAADAPQVITTLDERAFTLEPGMGFSDALTVRLPAELEPGTYALSLVVRRPGGPMVDRLPIQVGEGNPVRGPSSQEDMDAALEACAPVQGEGTEAEPPVEQAKADLARRMGIEPGAVEVLSVEAAEFPDASLGVPEPDQSYAQVVTPGYVIELRAGGETYRYHAGAERVVAVPEEPATPPAGRITIEDVTVTADRVTVRGTTTLPDERCVSAELWAGGAPFPGWPTDLCASIQGGRWTLGVPLEPGQALQPGVPYVVRAYERGGPNVVATWPFELDTPPSPPPGDPTLLLPESAEPLHRVSADLNGDGRAEEVVLAGWGGGADRLGYDFLQMFVITAGADGADAVAWQSRQLPTERAEALEVRDVNGDGRPEVLSVQAMGAGGETLYLLAGPDGRYGWLAPHGGHFDGRDAFGETGVWVEDVDGDGRGEILAGYGPAAAQVDVYAWDGRAYAYRETQSGAEASRVEGWTGSVYKLPPGNQFGRHLVRDDGETFGVGSNDEAINRQLQVAAWTGARIQVWGTLHLGVPAAEARHVQVERLEVVAEAAPEPRNLSPFATVSASSHLPADGYGTYHPHAAIDGSPETAWVEGAPGAGIGEWIELAFPDTLEFHALNLAVGYDESADVFAKNNRVKRATLVFSNGERATVEFADARGLQSVSLPELLGAAVEADAVTIVIEAVYPGTKYDDTCLAEVEVYGIAR